MRVLHVVRQFHPSVGGLESVVKSLSIEQRRSGIDASVITLDRVFRDPDNRLPQEEFVSGIPVRRIGYRGSRRYPIAPNVLSYVKDHDIIHVHGVDFFADYLAATSAIHRRHLVLSTHGGFFHTTFARRLKQLYFETVTRTSLRNYRRIFACSQNDARTFEHVSGDRLRVIENGVDTDKFADAAARVYAPSFVYFGRFASHKGLERLIDVFARVRQAVPDARLTLVGSDWDGTLENVQSKAAHLIADGSVRLEVDADDAALAKHLNTSSFFVSASEYEGFGLTVVEALSAGLIPIASSIPTFKNILGEAGVGLIANFANPDKAAHDIVEFLDRTSKSYDSLREDAKSASNQYSWAEVEKKFRAEYEEVLGLTKRTILGVNINVTTRDELAEKFDDAVDGSSPLWVAFANAHTLNTAKQKPAYRGLLNRFFVVNDGIGVDIASSLKFGRKFPENLNGTDFIPHFLGVTRHKLRIFLVGARPHVVRKAGKKLTQIWPQHEIVGIRDGYFRDEHHISDVCRAINRASPDLVLVGLGNPRQEQWISRHGPSLDTKLLVGVGALFDFISGNTQRAPTWVRRARCEWLFRFALEPRRLFTRYVVGNVVFLHRATIDRNRSVTP